MCAKRTDFKRLDRLFQIVDRARRRREMQHVIERTLAVDVIGYVVVDERQTVATDQMPNVRRASGDQLVHAAHLVPTIEEELAEVCSEESRTPRDQRGRQQARPA